MNTENQVIITTEQLKAIISMIPKDVIKSKCSKEVRDGQFIDGDSISVGYEQASYGDWIYYVTPSGECVCKYYDIGD